MAKIGAFELIDAVADSNTFHLWKAPTPDINPSPTYEQQLVQAKETSGLDESIVIGEARINGVRTCFIIGEFSFLAGTIGRISSERIVYAFERATKEGLPVFASPTSGGTRVQEGTLAFVQLLKISKAVADFRSSNHPYIVYLRHPTTGGPLVSWGSLSHVTFAQPGALIGMLGPRVGQVLSGEPLPPGTQQAENLNHWGLVDRVVEVGNLREHLIGVLDIIGSPPVTTSAPALDDSDGEEDAWQAIQATNNPNRPGFLNLINHTTTTFIPLWASQSSLTGNIVVGLADFGGFRCLTIGQERNKTPTQVTTLNSLAATQRATELAAQTNLPIVTFIDTFGIEVSRTGEEGGIASHIAMTVEALVETPVPVVSVILGAGTGVSALSLLPADRTVCASRAWLAPLPLEGASQILFRDPNHAPTLAAEQGIRPRDLRSAGVVDAIVPEQPDAAKEPQAFATRIAHAIHHQLQHLVKLPTEQRLNERWLRFRNLI